MEDKEIYDAFSQGVEPGGLRSREAITYLIFSLVKAQPGRLQKEQITRLLVGEHLANYFEVSDLLDDMLSKNNLVLTNGFLSLAPSYETAVKVLEQDLPVTVREQALTAASDMLTLEQRQEENQILVEHAPDGGYHATFTMRDGDTILMRLTVYVADTDQLEQVKQAFLNDPVRLYTGIIGALSME